jgi:hypothetical protein
LVILVRSDGDQLDIRPVEHHGQGAQIVNVAA